MPFNYEEYQQKCNGLSTEELQKEWEGYTRQIAGASTSTATSVLCSPLTGGVSLLGLGISAPRIHNARKKREIIEICLQARGTTHNTRVKDVAGSVALSGAIGGLSFGLLGPGADVIASVAADGAGVATEQKIGGHIKKQGLKDIEMKRMQQQLQMQPQYQGFQQQYVQGVPGMGNVQGGGMVQMGGFHQNGLQLQSHRGIDQGIQQPQFNMYQPGLQTAGLHPGLQSQLPPRPHSAAPDGKYEYAFMPPTGGNLQQLLPPPQQQLAQPIPQHQNAFPELPQYQFIQQLNGQIVAVPIPQEITQQPDPEKSSAYLTQEAKDPEFPAISPVYSQYDQTQPSSHIQPQPGSSEGQAPPKTASQTMEDEIASLRARLFQMELEKHESTTTTIAITAPLEVVTDGSSHGPPETVENQDPQTTVHDVTIRPEDDIQQPIFNPHLEPETIVINESEQSVDQQVDSLSAPQNPTSSPVTPSISLQASHLPAESPHAPLQSVQPASSLTSQTEQLATDTYAPLALQQHNVPQSSAITNLQTQQSATAQPPQAQEYTQHQIQNTLVATSMPDNHLVSSAPPQQQYAPPGFHVQNSYQTPPPPPQQHQQQPLQPQQQIYLPQPQQAQEFQFQPQTLHYQQSSTAPHSQPQYQRQDSGYYSVGPTPLQQPSSSIPPMSSGPITQQLYSTSQLSGSTPYAISQQPYSLQKLHNDQQQYSPQQHYNLQQQYNPQQPYNPQQQYNTQQLYNPLQQYNLQQQYNPQQGYNPQIHARSNSVVSPLQSPPPPPYVHSPGGPQPALVEKGYFPQGAVPQPLGYTPGYNAQM